MLTIRPTARVVTLVCAIAVVLLLVPFAGKLVVEPKASAQETMVLGGPQQDGGIPTSLKCSYTQDLTKPGMYACDDVLVESRIDRTGKDMRKTLRRMVRSDPTILGFQASRFSVEDGISRLEGAAKFGEEIVVLNWPYSGDFEGMSMYVMLKGPTLGNVEPLVRAALKEAEVEQV